MLAEEIKKVAVFGGLFIKAVRNGIHESIVVDRCEIGHTGGLPQIEKRVDRRIRQHLLLCIGAKCVVELIEVEFSEEERGQDRIRLIGVRQQPVEFE